ncbi:MAG: cysteine desulfurase family protein [Tissierellia bacterium]|nr:cysteine desulfurase family protein [Tissierellia bacterium]
MIYLDNAATTRMYDEVIDIESEMQKKYFANPASIHSFAMECENLIKDTKEFIAKYINAKPDEIFFTKGATESNNIAINSFSSDKKEAITSKLEHASVYESFKNSNYKDIFYVKNDKNGVFDLKDLENLITENTSLISLIHVNNEIATINDIEEIGRVIKTKNPNTIFHVDATQSFGKIKIDVKKAKIDIMSFSAHKIHGPKGLGAIFIKKDIINKLRPVLYGGRQEIVSSGTQNAPSIVAFKKALEIIDKRSNYEKIGEIKKYFIDRLNEIEDKKIISNINMSSNYILNCAFKNIKSEVLVHFLEDEKIYVTSGSACSHGKKSRILENINIGDEYIDGSIRFSFDESITKKDIDKTIDVLKYAIKFIREVY